MRLFGPKVLRDQHRLHGLGQAGFAILLEAVQQPIACQHLLRHMQIEGQRYEELVNEYALFHQQRLIEDLCLPKASSLFVAPLDYLKGITGHIGQIADKLSLESVA
jgi:hypothetical protein